MSKYKVIERLKEQDEELIAHPVMGAFRTIAHLVICEEIRLSIQASSFHYCEPRQTIDLCEYKEMEMRIISKYPLKELFLKDESILNELEKYEDSPMKYIAESSEFMTVYAYVPVELIEKVYLHLEKLFGEA